MDESLLGRILAKIGLAILFIALADLLFLNYWLVKNNKLRTSENNGQDSISTQVINPPQPLPSASLSILPSTKPEPEVKTVETKTIVEKQTQTIVQTAQKEIFIPIGSGSTKSRSFVDLDGLEVTIDTSKYSAIDSVVFEATIWVEGGNGQAYAQIRNVTDNNPLIESRISSNTGSGSLKSSDKIPIPAGQKVYRVQAKTDVENFAAHVENSRIKITLK